MSPRLKLRTAAAPLVIAGALWGGSDLLAAGAAARGQTPPPCSPDGVCLPRPETFGWYQTRWRTFPGDPLGRRPTEAEPQREDVLEGDELRGPQLPEATEESLTGPAPPDRPGAEEEEGAAATPSDLPLPGIGAPPTQPGQPPGQPPAGDVPQAQPPAEEAAPSQPPGADAGIAPTEPPASGAQPNEPIFGPQPGPGAEPSGNELDPFGTTPPTPPAWLSRAVGVPNAIQSDAQQTVPLVTPNPSLAPAAVLEQLPIVEPTAVHTPAVQVTAPAAILPAPMEQRKAANSNADDAPPALPESLRGLSGSGGPVQPSGILPVVTPASAEEPIGIQLVNPAAAIVVDPGEDRLQQAIYFEASDQ